MKKEDDIGLKQESEVDCLTCYEPFDPNQEVTLFVCCSTSSSLKALHSDCAQQVLTIKRECPCCRRREKQELKFVTVDNASFTQLIALSEEELKSILELSRSQTPEVFPRSLKLLLTATSDKQKELYFFLWKHNLSSPQYFDSSFLSIKLQKMLDDKVSHAVMFDLIEKFLAAGIDVNGADKLDWTGLLWICRMWPEVNVPPEKILAAIDKFLEAEKIDVNAVTKDGWTAPQMICRCWPELKVPYEATVSAFNKFLKVGIDVNLNKINSTLLHLICYYWPRAKIPHEVILTVIEKLLALGVKTETIDKNGNTALQILEVADEKLAKRFRLLIAARAAPPEQKDFYAFLLSNSLTSQEYSDDSSLPIKMSKLVDDKVAPEIMLSALEKFIGRGMDVNAVNKDGWNTLHYICCHWSKANVSPKITVVAIDKLLQAKINIYAVTNNLHWTALHFIFHYWLKEKIYAEVIPAMLDKLSKANIDLDASSSKGNTILHFVFNFWPDSKCAAVSSEIVLTIIDKLLSTKINVNAVDKEGWNALHYICCNWPKANVSPKVIAAVIDKLLQAKININTTTNKFQWSALHFICNYWPKAKISQEIILAVIGKLLVLGAETKTIDKSGKTALQILETFPEEDTKKLAKKFRALTAVHTAPPEKKDFYLSFLDNDLLSPEYFDDSSLSVKIKKLLDDKIGLDDIVILITEFIGIGIDVNGTDEMGWNALHSVCRYFPETKQISNALLGTAKHNLAVQMLHFEILLTAISKLVEARINVNAITENSWSVLHFICHYWPKTNFSHENILTAIEKLLGVGINVEITNDEDKTALQILETSTDKNIKELTNRVRLLMAAHAAPPEEKDFYAFLINNNLISQKYFNDSPLPVKLKKLLDDGVTFEVMLVILEKFLAMELNINAIDKYTCTALHFVCEYWPKAKAPPEMLLIAIDKLLAANIDVNAITNKGITALHCICCYWQKPNISPDPLIKIIDKLLMAKVNVNAADDNGWIALHYICRNWPIVGIPHETILIIIEKLLKMGANINTVNKEGKTPLQILETLSDENTKKLANKVRLIIVAQAPPEKKDFYTFLFKNNLTSPEYFDNSSLPVKVRKLLNDKVSPEIILAAVEKFLALEIDINVTDMRLDTYENGWTALHYICSARKLPSEIIDTIIDKLIAAGIKINATDSYGRTALYTACEPLIRSASKKILAIISKLITAGIDVNIANSEGDTVLHYISLYCLPAGPPPKGMMSAIHKLLEANANINLINTDSEKALDVDKLIYLLNENTEDYFIRKHTRPEINIQVVFRYLMQQMDVNETAAAAKIWIWVCEKSSRLQEFKTLVMNSGDYRHPLAFARLHRYVSKSFFKDNQEINAGYRKVIDSLLIPKNDFALSEEQLKILEEISAFDKQVLLPQLVMGLKYLFTTNIIKRDVHEAYQCFLQAAQSGWLLGYVLAAHQCVRGLGVPKDLNQASEYYEKITSSAHTTVNDLNKRYFEFALKKLHEFANEHKTILALKILGNYYLKWKKTATALDLFLKAKTQAEMMRQQEQKEKLILNQKLSAFLAEIDQVLGKLFYESHVYVKSSNEYRYGPACLIMAKVYLNNELGSQFFEAVECYCSALITPYEPQAKTALEGLTIIVAAIQSDKKSNFKIITTLIDFIDHGKAKFTDLQISLLLKLIQALKIEKLFLESVALEKTQDKLEFFLHKFSYKTHFSTVRAGSLLLLAAEDKSIQDICQIILKDNKSENVMQFYRQILEGKSELPDHIVDKEICRRAEQVLGDLKENFSELPTLT